MTIKAKVILSLIVVLAVGTAVLLSLANNSHQKTMRMLASSTLQSARNAFDQLERSDNRMLSAVNDTLRANETIVATYAQKKRDPLLALTQPVYADLKSRYGVTHWNFIDAPPDSVIFARLSKPELFGDAVKRQSYLESVKSGTLKTGMEIGKTGFVLRTVAPIQYKGAVVGYMEIGEDIDRFFKIIKEQTGSDVALVVAKKYMDEKEWGSTRAAKQLANNWGDHPSNLLVASTAANASVVPMDIAVDELAADGTTLGTVDQGGKVYLRSVFPVRDASKKSVGAVLVVQDVTGAIGEMKSTRFNLVIFTIALTLALSVTIVVILYRLVFSRLQRMIDTVTRVVGGDVNYTVKETDEIGRFESQLVDVLRTLMSQG